MAKTDNMALKILGLKLNESFRVSSESERQSALKTAKVLKSARMIKFRVTTRADEDGPGWKVVAI